LSGGTPLGTNPGELAWFLPTTIDRLIIPISTPDGIRKEFQEAEHVASVAAWRAASALLRSTLEKTLKDNGYTKGNLKDKIDQAAKDGIITEQRRKRAHEELRSLGNDILHDDYRAVTAEEFDLAHHYAQRILEDFYDDPDSVQQLLAEKHPAPPPPP